MCIPGGIFQDHVYPTSSVNHFHTCSAGALGYSCLGTTMAAKWTATCTTKYANDYGCRFVVEPGVLPECNFIRAAGMPRRLPDYNMMSPTSHIRHRRVHCSAFTQLLSCDRHQMHQSEQGSSQGLTARRTEWTFRLRRAVPHLSAPT